VGHGPDIPAARIVRSGYCYPLDRLALAQTLLMQVVSLQTAVTPMRFIIAFLIVLSSDPSWATNLVVRDGNTLQIADVTYRLDGIDAPEFDQMCIDEHADPWACGVEARDRLAKLIAGRNVHCKDLGPDSRFAKWHIGLCSVDGETDSLNQLLVHQGYALHLEPSGAGRFKDDETNAKDHGLGLWRGCFVAPQAFRRSEKTAPLLGASCSSDKDRELRESLFPDNPAMPPGCSIKAKFAVRARVTGNVGIYHLQECRSYAPLTKPDRWFCSEEDAQAAGFRKAYNCRVSFRRK
jgi:endonuclease YncB( thermonuclease family)